MRPVIKWLLCGLLVLIGLFAVWRTILYRDINRRIAMIQAAGLPTSGSELNTWIAPVPDDENGAVVLEQAFGLIFTFPDQRSNQVQKAELLARTNQWTAATCELVSNYVQGNVKALAKAREASRFKRFRYITDFSYGPDTRLPHLQKIKNLARLAALKTQLDTGEGPADQWPEDVELQLTLAGTLDDEPIMLSQLVRNAIIGMAVRATEKSLNQAGPSDEACKKLQTAFVRAEETNGLARALIGERAIDMPVFRLSRAEIQNVTKNDDEETTTPRPPQRYSGKPVFGVWLTGFLERDLDFFLETMDKSISLAALPPPASLAMTNQMDQASKIARDRYYMFSSLLLPSLSKSVVKEANTLASAELATTALAVERFRLAQDRLPDGLNEIAPKFIDAVPKDPFDGAPLRYKRLAPGYVIYSIGADGHDDGGREAPERRKSGDTNSYDITFVVER